MSRLAILLSAINSTEIKALLSELTPGFLEPGSQLMQPCVALKGLKSIPLNKLPGLKLEFLFQGNIGMWSTLYVRNVKNPFWVTGITKEKVRKINIFFFFSKK